MHAVTAYGGAEVVARSLLTSAVNGASCRGRFTPRKESRYPLNWWGLEAGPDVSEKRKPLASAGSPHRITALRLVFMAEHRSGLVSYRVL
jgi:hypothetical protein